MPLDADGAPVAERRRRRLETASKTMKTGQDGLKFTKMTKNRFLDFVILSSCQKVYFVLTFLLGSESSPK